MILTLPQGFRNFTFEDNVSSSVKTGYSSKRDSGSDHLFLFPKHMRYSFLLLSALFVSSAQGQTTFNVDMSCAPEGFTDVFVTGPWCGWCANDVYNTMTDDDGDGIYSVTVADLTGTVEYKYGINGFADQENLINDMVDGASCAPVTDFAGYANRQIEADGTSNDFYGTCDGTCNDNTAPVSTVDITFSVDVSETSFTSMSMAGTFNGWNNTANFMDDSDGDGVYTITLSMEPGNQEYKFLGNGDWANAEQFDGSEACTLPPGEFVNRVFAVEEGGASPDVVCFNSCDACDGDGGGDNGGGGTDPMGVTFNVDMSCAPAFDNVFVTGPWCGWCSNDVYNTMTDDDGDGVYSVTVSDLTGTVEYKYAINGFADQENLINDMVDGASCAPVTDFAGFANRQVEAGSTTSDYYGTCDGTCNDAAPVAVTFRVDMGEQETNPIGVFIAGNFQGWSAGATAMTDEDGDDVWEYTANISAGENVEYKFINGPNWGLDEAIPVACAVNGNRGFTVGTEDATLDAVCFGACTPCGSSLPTEEVTFTVLTDNITVAEDGMYLAGAMNGWSGEAMMDNGDGSWSLTKSLEAATYEFKFQNGAGGYEELDCGGNRAVVVELGAPIAVQGCFAQCAETCSVDPDPADVTFQVDASQIDVDSAGMYLLGSFTEPAWQFGAVQMNDNDADGIWTVTVNISGAASFQYKFNNGLTVVDGVANYSGEESADFAAEGCGVANGIGGFNRTHERSGLAETLDVVCFNSCSTCQPVVGTTFNVDMSCADAAGATLNGSSSFTEVFVTGPWCGWCANDGYNQLLDADGDGIYTAIIEGLADTVEYKYGIDGFADQEQLVDDMVAGADCAPITDFAGYANRRVPAGETANDVFGSCTSCEDQVPQANVTFRVDMSQYTETYGTVNLNGSFNGWCGACAEMLDEDGDNIYELTVTLPSGTVEYKFTLDGWNAQEEFEPGTECTSTIDGYTNRTLTFDADVVLDAVCWNSCDACASGAAGCTNPEFLEYDPYATEDDGSCGTAIVYGCIYNAASNYNPLANVDDNSCEFEAANDCPADLDQDGAVTTSDLLAFLATFGSTC